MGQARTETDTAGNRATGGRIVYGLRWWICGLLFASTMINYIDRQSLAALAPFLKIKFQWRNQDFALVLIAFRIAYTGGQLVMGRLIDRIGTRKGLTISVAWYSAVAVLTSLATGLRSLCAFRFLLGFGESANYPAAGKAVAEWFPARERAWAVAIYDTGSAAGGALVPAIVVWLYAKFGSWRLVFSVTGTLGFVWLILWRLLYYRPEIHPRISKEEKDMILRDKAESGLQEKEFPHSLSLRELLRLPQTWGLVSGRFLIDPVFFFIMEWFAIVLVAKGFKPETSVLALWVPFVAGDLGNFVGAGISSWLIHRGWPVVRSRKMVLSLFGPGMLALIPTIYVSNLYLLTMLFAVSMFSYVAWITMSLVLHSDLYPSNTVATVSGMSGTASGVGTIIATYLIGIVSDRYSFSPVLIGAGILPLIGTALTLLLVQNGKVNRGQLERRDA
jgi:ACS family hexuronate transporter-like MFS transporter